MTCVNPNCGSCPTEAAPHVHEFEKFDATRIYCVTCGEFRTAPSDSYKWTWTPPVYWWPTVTTTPQYTYTTTT